MGLSDKSCDVNLELLMDTIRCLDYESVIVENHQSIILLLLLV